MKKAPSTSEMNSFIYNVLFLNNEQQILTRFS